MKNIIPNLWFNTQSEEAVQFYTSLFENSSIGKTMRYDAASAKISGQQEGSVLTVEFTLADQPFIALNGGPQFTFNPSISLYVSCDSEEEVDRLYTALSEGGGVLMELQEYPFSKKYAWVSDKYGVSWQLNLMPEPAAQKISPSLLYVGDQAGKAEEAMNLYTSLFPDSSVEEVSRYTAEDEDTEGYIKYGRFSLNGQQFIAMDSSYEHKFAFNEAISLMVNCDDQEEVDRYWDALIADGGEASVCGWLKDKYGVAWQITPLRLEELLADPDKEKASRVMQAMLQMKKIVVADLEAAANGK